MAIPKSEVADPFVGDRCFRLVDVNCSRPSIERVSHSAMGNEYPEDLGAWIQPSYNRFDRIMKRLLRHPRRSNYFNAGYRGARHRIIQDDDAVRFLAQEGRRAVDAGRV